MQGTVAQPEAHLALHLAAQRLLGETDALHLHLEIPLAFQSIVLGQGLQQRANIHPLYPLVYLIAGGLLAGIEHATRRHPTTGHPGAELLEVELATGQGELQIHGVEIQPLHPQAAQLQPTGQIHRLEGGEIRLHGGERLGGGSLRLGGGSLRLRPCRSSSPRGGRSGRRLGWLTEPGIEIEFFPLEIELPSGHAPQPHGAVAAEQGLVRPQHQVAQGDALLVELRAGKACQLQLHLRAWQAIATELGGQHRIRHLHQLQPLIEPRLEGALQGTCQGRLVRRPLGAAQVKGQAAPLPQRQPIGLEGEGIEPLRWLAQAAAEAEILQLAGLGLPGQLELGLPLEIKVQLPARALGGQGHRYPLPRGQLTQIEVEPVETGDGAAAIVPHQGAGLHQCHPLQADLPGLLVAGDSSGRLALAG